MDPLPKFQNYDKSKLFPFMEDLMQQDDYIQLNKYKKKMDKDYEHNHSKMKKSYKREKSDRQSHKKKDSKEFKHRDRYKESSSRDNHYKDRDSDERSDTYRSGGSKTSHYYRRSDRSSSPIHRRKIDRNRYDRHDRDTRKYASFSSKKYDERTSHHKSGRYDNSIKSSYHHENVSPRQKTLVSQPDTECWDTDHSDETVVFKTNKKYKLADKCSTSIYRDDISVCSAQSTTEESLNNDNFADHMRNGRRFILDVLKNTSNEALDTNLEENSLNQKITKSNIVQDNAPNIDTVKMACNTFNTTKPEPIDYNPYEALVDESNLEPKHHPSEISQYPKTIRSKDPRLQAQAMRYRSQNESLQSNALSTPPPAFPFSFRPPSLLNSHIYYPDRGLPATPIGFPTNSTQPHAYWSNMLPQNTLPPHPMMVPPVTTYKTNQANILHQLSVSSTYTSSTHQPFQEPLNTNYEYRPFERQNYEQSSSTRRAGITYGEYRRSRASFPSTSYKNSFDTSNRSSNISQAYINPNPIPTVVTNSMGFKNFKMPKAPPVSTMTKVSQINGIKNNEISSTGDRDAKGSFKLPSQANDSATAGKQFVEQNTTEDTNKFLKELLNPNNFLALVNLMGGVAEVNKLDEVKEMLEKRERGTKESHTDTEMDKSNVELNCKTDIEKLHDHGHILFRRYSVLKTSGERTPAKAEDDVVKGKQKSRISSLRVRTSRSYSTVDESSDSTAHPDEPPAKRVKPPKEKNRKNRKKIKETIRNNNPEWHSLNTTMNCSICDKPKGRSLMSHYVNDHPNVEVHTSRIPPVVAKLLHDPKHSSRCEVIQRRSINRDPQLKQFCYFCNKYKCYNKSLWITHMCIHTGYYRYKCIDCSRKFAVKNRTHVCKVKNNLEKIPQPQFDKESLMAYVCDVCNYVRFNETEIKQHLHSAHEENMKESFKEVVFLQLPKNKKKEKEDAEESDNDSDTYGTESDDEGAQQNMEKPDTNEPKETRSVRSSPKTGTSSETNKAEKEIANTYELANKEITIKRPVNETEDAPNPETVTVKTEPGIKNNNPAFHSLATEIKCQICDVRDRKSLVNHYVNFHANSEVLISRLAPDVANSLRSEKSQPLIKDKIKDKFEQFCYFCDKLKCYSKWSWVEHLVKHTGYFQYKCSDCGLKFVRNDPSHVCKYKNNIEMVPQPQFADENVMAYICDICNYVRFHEFEIQQHLHSEHDGDFTRKFTKVLFLRLPQNKTKKQHAEENENEDTFAQEQASNAVKTSAAVPTYNF